MAKIKTMRHNKLCPASHDGTGLQSIDAGNVPDNQAHFPPEAPQHASPPADNASKSDEMHHSGVGQSD
jgi:hypothetical protein